MTFVDLILIAVSGVLFTFMIDDFIEEGMIFSFWGRYLEAHEDAFWLKPLWGCLTCTNIWMIAIMALAYTFLPSVWWVLLLLSSGNWILNLLIKKDLN